MKSCVIIDNAVTGICSRRGGVLGADRSGAGPDATITPVAAKHTSISGTLSTTNFVMASWSKTMWQDVMNRGLRMLASTPLGPLFISASSTVDGN
ncbi:hypothetical protein KIN20_029539 [Parelaphostrongylus tenuis]|uniref:Uncharacterized protein n=1 Tax=Parelaphostrongylus tenuis TaxID=148309 RepID=A0AAD5R2Q3_PARTN|nr:hypothetical protein KIN20_029539 [Parelaphostrongylus tenuis]